jgi:hypothetical protein
MSKRPFTTAMPSLTVKAAKCVVAATDWAGFHATRPVGLIVKPRGP